MCSRVAADEINNELIIVYPLLHMGRKNLAARSELAIDRQMYHTIYNAGTIGSYKKS